MSLVAEDRAERSGGRHSRRTVLASTAVAAAAGVIGWILPIEFNAKGLQPTQAFAYDCPTSNDLCPPGYGPVSCSFMDCALNCRCTACGGNSSEGNEETYIHCSGVCFDNATQQFAPGECSYTYYVNPSCSCSSAGCDTNYGGDEYLGSC